MSYITIPSGIKDPSYRYKMRKMVLQGESRGNGIKTNIFNIEDVADDLRVPSIVIMKFMCAELGANMEGTSIIKGQHTYGVMLEKLDKFIGMYILCQNCNYPETKHFIAGKKDLKSKCNSCGHANTHNSTHKSGKALINHLAAGGKQITDIQESDKLRDNDGDEEDKKKKKKKKAEDDDDSEEEKGKKKDKKKGDKKKKKKDLDSEEHSDNEDKEDDIVSENDEELTWQSRRIGKYF